jgi:hypothetical protein
MTPNRTTAVSTRSSAAASVGAPSCSTWSAAAASSTWPDAGRSLLHMVRRRSLLDMVRCRSLLPPRRGPTPACPATALPCYLNGQPRLSPEPPRRSSSRWSTSRRSSSPRDPIAFFVYKDLIAFYFCIQGYLYKFWTYSASLTIYRLPNNCRTENISTKTGYQTRQKSKPSLARTSLYGGE